MKLTYFSALIFSRRILEENEPDYYSGKFFFLFFSSDHRMYA